VPESQEVSIANIDSFCTSGTFGHITA